MDLEGYRGRGGEKGAVKKLRGVFFAVEMKRHALKSGASKQLEDCAPRETGTGLSEKIQGFQCPIFLAPPWGPPLKRPRSKEVR